MRRRISHGLIAGCAIFQSRNSTRRPPSETRRRPATGLRSPDGWRHWPDIHAAQGELVEADHLYQRAADVVEAVMLNAPSSTAQARLIGVTSEVFLGHFRVAVAQQLPAKAFTILEQARGRAIADLLRVSSRRDEWSFLAREQMQYVSRLQGRLLSATSTRDRQALLDALWQAEQDMLPERMASRAVLASNRAPITMASLRRVLRPDETILEYAVDEPRSFCLVITRRGPRTVPLWSDSFSVRYSARIRMFRYFTNPANPPDSPAGGHCRLIGPASFHCASAGSVGLSVMSQISWPFNHTCRRAPLNAIRT